MTKSAMEQMVEYLEKNKERHYGSLWSEVRAEARRLLSEEQAQKPPTDMAGLVEELEAWGNKAVLEYNVCNINWAAFDEILSRYARTSTDKCDKEPRHE